MNALFIPLSLWYIKLAPLLDHFSFIPSWATFNTPSQLPSLQGLWHHALVAFKFFNRFWHPTPDCLLCESPLHSVWTPWSPMKPTLYPSEVERAGTPFLPHLVSDTPLWATSPLRCPLCLQQVKPAAISCNILLYTSKLQHPTLVYFVVLSSSLPLSGS